MENQNNEMKLNESAIAFLRESAKWSMFLAIIGFVGIAIMVIAGIFMGTIMSSIPAMGGGMNNGMSSSPFTMMPGLMAGFYIVIAILYFFPIYYLFKYAQNTKMSLQSSNSDLLADALGYLKSHHKFLGIMMIIIISLYILIAIIGVVAFASMM